MGNSPTRPIVAVFADRGQAEAAVDELWHDRFDKNQIGIAAPGESLHQAATATEAEEDAAGDAALDGALVGTAVGTVAGAVAVAAIPGVGPILAGGALIALGAAAGAALGTFAGPFVAMGVSKDAATHYEAAFRAGRTIVVVKSDDRADKAQSILREHGPLEMWLPDGSRQVFYS